MYKSHLNEGLVQNLVFKRMICAIAHYPLGSLKEIIFWLPLFFIFLVCEHTILYLAMNTVNIFMSVKIENFQYLISQTARVGIGVFFCTGDEVSWFARLRIWIPLHDLGFWEKLIPIIKMTPSASNSRRNGSEKLEEVVSWTKKKL